MCIVPIALVFDQQSFGDRIRHRCAFSAGLSGLEMSSRRRRAGFVCKAGFRMRDLQFRS